MSRSGETTSPEIEGIARETVDAAFKVYSKLGPSLLESYRTILSYELRRGLEVQCEVPVPVVYESVALDASYRLDLLMNKLVVVELKAIEKLARIHDGQLLTYLKLTGHRHGILINFNTRLIKNGIKRIVL